MIHHLLQTCKTFYTIDLYSELLLSITTVWLQLSIRFELARGQYLKKGYKTAYAATYEYASPVGSNLDHTPIVYDDPA